MAWESNSNACLMGRIKIRISGSMVREGVSELVHLRFDVGIDPWPWRHCRGFEILSQQSGRQALVQERQGVGIPKNCMPVNTGNVGMAVQQKALTAGLLRLKLHFGAFIRGVRREQLIFHFQCFP